QFLLRDSALRICSRSNPLEFRSALYVSVFTSYDFETTTRKTFAVAMLSDFLPNYFGQERFREPANFRMRSDSRSQRATLAADDNLFATLLNASSPAYCFQRSECPTDTALHVTVLFGCRLNPG